MAEYIEREAAISALCYDCSATQDCRPGERCADYIRLKNIPAADVAPVRHGRWVAESVNSLCSCSCCGKTAPYDVEADTIMYWPGLNYCPNCGAKMDKEDDNG